MNFKKDYTGYASLIAILVIVFLAAASRIPGTKIGEIKLKKINILSDLIEDDAPSDLGGDLYFDTTFLAEADAIEANMPSLEPVQSREQGAVVVETERDFQEAQTAVPTSPRPLPDSSGSVVMKRPTVEIPYLEDFGDT